MRFHPGVRTTEEELDAALEAAKSEPAGPELIDVQYLREHDLFILKIDNGRRLTIPREDIWAVHEATQDEAADFVIEPFRNAIWWPQVDEGLRLENALEGR